MSLLAFSFINKKELDIYYQAPFFVLVNFVLTYKADDRFFMCIKGDIT